MTTAVSAYAATSATEPLTKTTITRRDVGPHDVAFDIHFAGICHSDIHTVRGEWGEVQYPMVPGHEIAGIVSEVGSEVTKYKVGDRVGVGCFVDSCRECEYCLAGEEQYCNNPGMVGTYNGVGRDGQPTQGGYSGAIVVDENYVLRIPDAIPLDGRRTVAVRGHHHRTPHCGTGTPARAPRSRSSASAVSAPRRQAGGRARRRGHGAQPDAQEDGGRAAARRHRVLRDQRPDTFTKLAGQFDLILNTVSANLDMADYLSLLTLDGTLVELGMPENPMAVPAGALIFGRRSIAGSLIGGIAETQEMLDFCAEHGVQPEIEVIAPDYINEAYERTIASDVRYRFVIDTASLR